MYSLTQTREFTQDVVEEVKKVTWPDWQQLKSATGVIIVFVIIVAAIIWLMDLGVRMVINNVIMNLFAG